VRPGTTNQLLTAGGDQGGFVREVPASYTGRVPLPVVIDLHGWSEPAAFQVQISQLGAYGAAHRFITVTPQVAEPALVWKLGFSGKDVAFVGGLLHTIDTTLCVDRNRVRSLRWPRWRGYRTLRGAIRRAPCRSSPSTAPPTRSCPIRAASDRPR
jgi:poly(3-hydroxybutyrate) depolymerase